MPNDESKAIEKSIARLRECLSSRGLRYTAEREAILRLVMSSPTHCTPRQVHEGVEALGMHVSLSTVYNTLALLEECRLIVSQHFDGHGVAYEPMLGEHNHLHLVCSNCGKVKEVRDPGVSTLLHQHSWRTFTPSHFAVTIYGVCSTCQRKMRRNSKKTGKI